MKVLNLIPISIALFALTACEFVKTVPPEPATITTYSPPEASGLTGLRPFPSPADFCQVIEQTEDLATMQYEGRALIACPKHETGAIDDRRAAGALVVGNAKHWVILSVLEGHI